MILTDSLSVGLSVYVSITLVIYLSVIRVKVTKGFGCLIILVFSNV